MVLPTPSPLGARVPPIPPTIWTPLRVLNKTVPSTPSHRLGTRHTTMPHTTRCPPFSIPISVVLYHRTDKQMSRINARRVITRVANTQTVRNIPKGKKPSQTRRYPNFPLIPNRPVPLLATSCRPGPAILRRPPSTPGPKILWSATPHDIALTREVSKIPLYVIVSVIVSTTLLPSVSYTRHCIVLVVLLAL